MNTNKEVKWRRLIVPKIFEHINDYLFIDTHKSNQIQTGMNEMRVNDSKMFTR